MEETTESVYYLQVLQSAGELPLRHISQLSSLSRQHKITISLQASSPSPSPSPSR